MHLFDGDALDQLIRLALVEDVGAGDLTTESVVPETARGAAACVAKEELVLSGVDAAERTFFLLDPTVEFTAFRRNGDRLLPGDVAFELRGPLRALLTGERTALNFMQRLSGIATKTALAVRALEGTKTQLLDTRKTTPGLRSLEKRAVRHGGGHGHRTSLADGVMIKDNHIAAAGSIRDAVARARAFVHPLVKIEVEVTNLDELNEALDAGADMILLDNMTSQQLAECVRLVDGRVPLEASGNMTLERLRRVADAGVDFISMGALTHSAAASDLSLRITQVDGGANP